MSLLVIESISELNPLAKAVQNIVYSSIITEYNSVRLQDFGFKKCLGKKCLEREYDIESWCG